MNLTVRQMKEHLVAQVEMRLHATQVAYARLTMTSVIVEQRAEDELTALLTSSCSKNQKYWMA